MGLFRLAAVVLFGIAALCSFGWIFNATTTTDLGLVAAGLFFWALDGIAALALPSVQRP